MTINASGGIYGIVGHAAWLTPGNPAAAWKAVFNVGQNATLDINAATTGRTGFPAIATQAWPKSTPAWAPTDSLTFSGKGDVNVNATVENGNAVLARYLDNMALTGNLTLTGRSQSGSGIVID
ncbi:hypothetical protein ACE3VH_004740, partial [Salmonella enterica]